MQVQRFPLATTFEMLDGIISSLIAWKRREPAATKPLFTRHLLALGIIPLLQPHLRWLVGLPAAAHAECRQPAASSPQGTDPDAPPAPSNTQPAVTDGSLAAWRAAAALLQQSRGASTLPRLQKISHAVSILDLWANTFGGEALDAACWSECLRGALQVLADVEPLLRLAAIGSLGREEGWDSECVALNAVAYVFQQLATSSCDEQFPPGACGGEDARGMWVEAHLQLAAAMNREEALPHLVDLVCGGSGCFHGVRLTLAAVERSGSPHWCLLFISPGEGSVKCGANDGVMLVTASGGGRLMSPDCSNSCVCCLAVPLQLVNHSNTCNTVKALIPRRIWPPQCSGIKHCISTYAPILATDKIAYDLALLRQLLHHDNPPRTTAHYICWCVPCTA
jgi:hypothetical protein